MPSQHHSGPPDTSGVGERREIDKPVRVFLERRGEENEEEAVNTRGAHPILCAIDVFFLRSVIFLFLQVKKLKF